MTVRTAVLILSLLLAGCVTAPQEAIPMNDKALSAGPARVGIGMTALPKVDTHLPGAGCLLCMAAASMANQSLTNHAQTLPHEDLPKLKDEIAALLRKKGMNSVVVSEALNVEALPSYGKEGANVAKKDFSSLRQKYGIDKLLVISIEALGFERQYSAYVASSDPKGLLRGTGYLVNLADNTYEWYMPVNVLKAADGTWDEAPKFPGLTNAYFQAIELGKDQFTRPFEK